MNKNIEKNDKSPLLPDRQEQRDFFVCDIFDASPKGDRASMEHPVFSLSTKPDTRLRRYEHNGNYIEIIPSILGLATVHDRDILIFCISQIMFSLNAGNPVSQTVRFKAYDLLKATNRATNGQGYEGLKNALERLAGTRITTNIITGDEEITKGFGLIDSYEIVRKTRDGRMLEVEIELSTWIFNAIRFKEVLTIHRNYFRLRRPLERRIYELARKHCGNQKDWRISLTFLQKKCGSNSTLREFRRLVQNIVKQDAEHAHIPDYMIRLDNKNTVVITNRKFLKPQNQSIILDAETYHDARTVAQGWDVYYLENEWRNWMTDGGLDAPQSPDRAFLGFVQRWVEKRGQP